MADPTDAPLRFRLDGPGTVEVAGRAYTYDMFDHLRTRTLPMPETDAPALPYAVAYRPFGPSASRVEHPVKVRPPGLDGEILTPDELAVWAYVQHLEAENARLREAKPKGKK